MTNEEIIAYLKECNENLVSTAKDENVYDYEKQVIEADCMRRTFEVNEKAIKTLEQQPCEDCVSRKTIQKAIKDMLLWINSGNRGNADYFIVDKVEEIINQLDIDNLPFVTSKEKTGHWILDETDNSITCSKCGCLIWTNDIINGEAYYCPNCGAKNGGRRMNEYKSTEDVLDKIVAEIEDTGAYEQEVNGKTEFVEGITYCLNIINKYKTESEK